MSTEATLTLNSDQVNALEELLTHTFDAEFFNCRECLKPPDWTYPTPIDCDGYVFEFILTLDNALHGTEYTFADHLHKEDLRVLELQSQSTLIWEAAEENGNKPRCEASSGAAIFGSQHPA